jgi:hypothetical protein
MKLTKRQLKQLIKEELGSSLREEEYEEEYELSYKNLTPQQKAILDRLQQVAKRALKLGLNGFQVVDTVEAAMGAEMEDY